MIWHCIVFICLIGQLQGLTTEDDDKEIWIMEDGISCGGEYNETSGKLEFNSNTADSLCTWIIKPLNASGSVYLLLERLQLDKDDVVIIKKSSNSSSNSSDEFVELEFEDNYFDPFHAREDAIVLITGQNEIVVELNTSSANTMRHFTAKYASPTCAFTIDDDIPTISQPIYAKNATEPTTCIYNYSFEPDITFAFHFDSFSMNKSTVNVTGVQEIVNTLTGFDLPGDMLSVGNHQTVSFTIKMDPHYPSDKFTLSKHNVYEACSGQMETGASESIKSPDPLPVLHNPKVPFECRWHLKNINDEGALRIQFDSVTFLDPVDVLSLVDGLHFEALPFMQVTQSSEKAVLNMELRTSSPHLMIVFKPTSFASNFKAKVSVSGSGRYLRNNGTLRGTPMSNDENGTVFLLEVPSEQSVVLNLSEMSIGGDAMLNIYEDFNTQSRQIASVHSNVWYPIISSTNRMMIKSVNFKLGEFAGDFGGILPGCMHMSSAGASDSYILSGSCNKVCSWIIPPVASEEDLFLHFQYVNLEKGDHIQVLKLDKDKTLIADIAYNTTTLPQFWLSPRDGAYINITRGTCPAGQEEKIILVARSNYLPTCSKNYTIADFGGVKLTSPNYPNMYPLLMSCELRVTRASANQVLHLSFEQFDLAPDHCINLTQIVGKEESHLQISGNLMPNDYVFTGDLVVRFVSSRCNSSHHVQSFATGQGFSLNIRSTDCGGYSSLANATLTDSASKDLCIWKVTVPHNGTIKNSVNTLVYDSYDVDKFGNYKLDVYDGPSVRDKKIVNDTTESLWSRTNSLIFIYERLNSSKPSSEVQITYTTKSCLATALCDNGICMHNDWRCNGKNDCGDFSDEHNCVSIPIPTGETPADSGSGISPIVFGLCSVVFIVLGIALAIVVPVLMQRFRDRYYHLHEISVIE